jgi:hypothetical protein
MFHKPTSTPVETSSEIVLHSSVPTDGTVYLAMQLLSFLTPINCLKQVRKHEVKLAREYSDNPRIVFFSWPIDAEFVNILYHYIYKESDVTTL